jgi:hypothetical protein
MRVAAVRDDASDCDAVCANGSDSQFSDLKTREAERFNHAGIVAVASRRRGT